MDVTGQKHIGQHGHAGEKLDILIGPAYSDLGEFISHYMDWSRRDVAVLFGDACGAVVLEACPEETGLLAAKIGCEADARYAIQITNLGSCYSRLENEFLYVGWNFDGQEVFKRAVRSMAQACQDVLQQTGLTVDDIGSIYPWRVGRFQHLFQACDENGIKRPTVLITEWGWEYKHLPEPSVAMASVSLLT